MKRLAAFAAVYFGSAVLLGVIWGIVSFLA